MAPQDVPPTRTLFKTFRLQDAVLVLLFGAMAAINPLHDPWEIVLIAALAILQISESKLTLLESTSARVVWIVLKLIVGYLLIGYTDGIESNYYLILLLPVVSAAMYLGVFGTLFFAVVACGAYLSFLLPIYVDWNELSVDPDQQRVLALRLIFLALAGTLVNALGQVIRVQFGRYKSVAEKLVEANRHVQEAEAAVRRSERLAALGQLSAGLAHELRNPLGTIKSSAEVLAKNVAQESDITREMAGFISSEVDRTNSLVTRFLDFARPLHLHMVPSDLGQVIDRSVALLERDAAKYPVTVYRNYSPDVPLVPLDADMMKHVFYNLLLNAAQATAAGGAITIKTRVASGPDNKDIAEVSVIDRGSGIDPAIIETIFNPFVTTKREGVGLGLAIVSKIVDEHGGKMAVESEPGKGSVFMVHLPIS